MVTDPPYGVDLEPQWREEAGLNPQTRQGGEVANDDRIDWSEAWALFPGDVAYVWHAGIHAAEVALGLRYGSPKAPQKAQKRLLQRGFASRS
jgi:hypothetical protein